MTLRTFTVVSIVVTVAYAVVTGIACTYISFWLYIPTLLGALVIGAYTGTRYGEKWVEREDARNPEWWMT